MLRKRLLESQRCSQRLCSLSSLKVSDSKATNSLKKLHVLDNLKSQDLEYVKFLKYSQQDPVKSWGMGYMVGYMEQQPATVTEFKCSSGPIPSCFWNYIYFFLSNSFVET